VKKRNILRIYIICQLYANFIYFGKEYLKGLDLNKRQITAMESIKKIGKITNKGYREMFPEISDETARLDLNTLVRKKVIE
jgi:ATP-dependent DNA helicase RecG